MRFQLFLAAAATLLSTPLIAAELSVTVSGIELDRGEVHLVLYSPETFLDEAKSLAIKQRASSSSSLTFHFNQLKAGNYALVAYHDEDGDGKLDRFLGMIPSEGYGLSRNPKVFGKPKFDDASILLEQRLAINITLKY